MPDVAVPAAPETPAAPVTATPEAPKAEEPRVSSAFAQLTRKERALEAERRAWKAQRDTEAAEHAADIKAAKEWAAQREAIKKTPLKALEILGTSYDEMTQAQLNDGVPPPDLAVRGLEEKIEALKSELAAEKATKEAEAKKQTEAQRQTELSEARVAAAKLVADGGEKFELVNSLGLQDYVVKMVEEHWDQNQEWVPPEVAAEKLEAHLQAGNELPDVPFATAWKKLTATKWFKSKYADVPPPAKPAAEPPVQSTRVVVPEKKEPSPTISPRMTTKLSTTRPTVSANKGAQSYRDQLRAKALQTFVSTE